VSKVKRLDAIQLQVGGRRMSQAEKIERIFRTVGIGLILTFGSLFAPSIAYPKVVTSPEELGSYSFESFVDSRHGSIAEVVDTFGPDTSVSVDDPVIDGERVEDGIITAGTTMTIDGPATWMNVDLWYAGTNGVQSAFIDVTSRVTYDLAAFGTSGPVQIRLTGESDRESRGRNLLGSLSRARGRMGYDVELYETDANGNANAIVWAGSPQQETSTAGSDGIITINTNRLYKVVVSSTMVIEIAYISAFFISGSSKVGPVSWSSLTEGAEVHVSRFNGELSPAHPHRGTSRTDGEETTALVAGGVRLIDAEIFKADFRTGDTIDILASINPALHEIGRIANIFVVVASGNDLLQITPDGLSDFDGTVEGLIAFEQLELKGITEVNILSPFGGQVVLGEAEVGEFEIFIGYEVEQGLVTYNSEPIYMNVSSQ